MTIKLLNVINRANWKLLHKVFIIKAKTKMIYINERLMNYTQ